MKVGDWVKSYSKGIWQIYRIERVKYSFPNKNESTTIYSKRLLNEKGKRSFSCESCNQMLVFPISKYDEIFLKKFIEENPKVISEFNKYHRPIDSIMNLSLFAKDSETRSEIERLASDKFQNISTGLTDSEISEIWDEHFLMYKDSTIRNLTIQFISADSKTENNKIIYSKLRILNS
ncbi:hypothetical protein [Fulvivirga lutimaris]|uniref:hypothetical protein n=1 Tax=Fulvivirga lutimaris TaxID=1819566 RepID=UPI0012BC511B|nr:hypothetical protein [Fulvivirga lutimaris]MTI41086.1 hypothetical protein [Fulvivirga lutimaris]